MKTKKLKTLMLIAVLSTSSHAFANEFEKDGIYYNILSYSDRTVEVTCQRTMSRGSVVIDKYASFYSDTVNIPKKVLYNNITYTVVGIGNGAFYKCSGLTAVTMPNSITSIGEDAFFKCDSLPEIFIPSSITSIGIRAFKGCAGLTKIVVEEGNKIYDSRDNCNALIETATNTLLYGGKTSVIPNSVTSIGEGAFFNSYDLTSITIPNSIESIGNEAFEDCSLVSVDIPNSVINVGNRAFAYCDGLKNVTIGNSVTTIGDYAFYGCTSLSSITIPNSVTSIGFYAFDGCYSLTSAIIPNSLTTIGVGVFGNCSDLTSITIPNSVTTIDFGAFWYCSSLTSIIIPNSVTSIGAYAFDNCTNLTSVTIGKSVSTIGNYAFNTCAGLTEVYCKSTTPPSYSGTFPENVLQYATLYVPIGHKSAYESVDPWRNFWNIEEKEFSGIESTISDSDVKVSSNNGNIMVVGVDDNENIEVYAINGQCVYSGSATMIPVETKGIYIVKVNGKLFKLII